MSAGPRVRAVAALLWVVVATGPLLGGAALLRHPPADQTVDLDRPPPTVLGFAEVTVVAHLSGLVDGATSPVVPAHPALRPTGDRLEGLSTTERAAATSALATPVHAAAAVGATPAGPGRWGVTVAVLRGVALEGWQVTVADAPGGPLAELVPVPVALPAATAPPVPAMTPLQVPDPTDPLTVAVQRFLDALLADDGEVQRYLAAEAHIDLPAVRATRVELRRLSTGPVDGGRLAVLAEARAIRVDGSVLLLQYPLLLQGGGGRWEVVRLLPALPVQTSIDDGGDAR